MKEFVKTDKDGILTIDRVLFESFYPILFSCKNDKGETFICICCQNNSQGIKWLVGKTNVYNIVKMLKDEISIRQLLLDYTSEKISVDYKNEHYQIKYLDEWKKDSIYLPKEDSYINAEPGEFDDDIRYYLENKNIPYSSKEYENIIEKTASIRKDIVDIDNMEAGTVYFVSNNIVTSEIIQTYQSSFDVCTRIESYITHYQNNGFFQNLYNIFLEKSTNGVIIELSDVFSNNLIEAA